MGVTYDRVPRTFISRMAVPYVRKTLQVNADACVIHAAGNYARDPKSDLAKVKVSQVLMPGSLRHFVRARMAGLKRHLHRISKDRRKRNADEPTPGPRTRKPVDDIH